MPLFAQTTTAQNIMDASSQDVRKVLSSTATPDNSVLLDYVNRVSLFLLRVSRWKWSLAPIQRFITQQGVTDYWVGPSGQATTGTYDTGLNLTDLRTIKPGTVYDRSNFHELQQFDVAPLTAKLAYPDTLMRLGRPAVWRQDPDTPNVMNLYPAPDNESTYSPQPEAPICTTSVGGNLANRVYWVAVTLVDSLGNESTPGNATNIFIPAGSLVKVAPPQEPISSATGIKYDRYNVYAGQSPSNEPLSVASLTLQTTTPVSTATSWTEPTSGLTTTGVNPPSDNLCEPIQGYVIEFRYFRSRTQITQATQVLQVPDDYKDIVVAGTNFLTFHYLHEPQQAEIWQGLFQQGVVSIIRDLNLGPRGADYIHPDAATIGGTLPAVESIDLSVLIP